MVIKPPYQGDFIYFPVKKAHFFTLPLPFTTSLRTSWDSGLQETCQSPRRHVPPSVVECRQVVDVPPAV